MSKRDRIEVDPKLFQSVMRTAQRLSNLTHRVGSATDAGIVVEYDLPYDLLRLVDSVVKGKSRETWCKLPAYIVQPLFPFKDVPQEGRYRVRLNADDEYTFNIDVELDDGRVATVSGDVASLLIMAACFPELVKEMRQEIDRRSQLMKRESTAVKELMVLLKLAKE